MSKARLYHSNRKQGFTFELEEGRVVIEGFVNEINNKLCVVPLKSHDNANLKGKTLKSHDNANLKGKTLKSHDNANLKGKTQI